MRKYFIIVIVLALFGFFAGRYLPGILADWNEKHPNNHVLIPINEPVPGPYEPKQYFVYQTIILKKDKDGFEGQLVALVHKKFRGEKVEELTPLLFSAMMTDRHKWN